MEIIHFDGTNRSEFGLTGGYSAAKSMAKGETVWSGETGVVGIVLFRPCEGWKKVRTGLSIRE